MPALMHSRMLLYYQGKVHEAELEVRQALARYPDQFKLLTFLGDFLYYQGKTDEAQQVSERAVKAQGPPRRRRAVGDFIDHIRFARPERQNRP